MERAFRLVAVAVCLCAAAAAPAVQADDQQLEQFLMYYYRDPQPAAAPAVAQLASPAEVPCSSARGRAPSRATDDFRAPGSLEEVHRVGYCRWHALPAVRPMLDGLAQQVPQTFVDDHHEEVQRRLTHLRAELREMETEVHALLRLIATAPSAPYRPQRDTAVRPIDGGTDVEYLSVRELATRIPYSEGAIRNLMTRGVFRLGEHYLKPRGRVAFRWSAVQAWLRGENRVAG